MKNSLVALAIAGIALATPMPQGVTEPISPSSPAPEGCSLSAPGKYQITVVNVTSSASKRSVESRQLSGILTVTLDNGVLTDQAGRTGYIASNYQFQFDAPPQAGGIYTSGFSLCSNQSFALGGSSIFYQCYSGGFYNLYDRHWAAQCSPVYFVAQSGSANPPATQLPDGQPGIPTQAPGYPVSQIPDGQPQAPTGYPISQLPDGQPQAPGSPVSQLPDGQPQAPTGGPAISQISDGQPQAPTGYPISQISDGQPQAPTGYPISQISDGQPQAPTGYPISQISDGQPQAPTGYPISQISDGQPQAPTGYPISQISDGQPQGPPSYPTNPIAPPVPSGNYTAPSTTAPPPAEVSDSGAGTATFGMGALAAGAFAFVAFL